MWAARRVRGPWGKASPPKDTVPVMVTARANKQHWLSPAGRSLWTLPVSGVLLFLLMIGGAGTLFPAAHEHPSTGAPSESGLEDTDTDETPTPAAPLVSVSRSRKTKSGFSPTASSLQLNASTLPHTWLSSALPVGAFAKQNGPGISMRC